MPFDELPLEIIQRVFRLCCGSVTFIIPSRNEIRQGTEQGNLHPWRKSVLTVTPRKKTRLGTTQVTLSLVCSRWREIALNARTLWGDVIVYYDPNKDSAHDLTVSFRFVHNWLNRAGMTPISLSISVFQTWQSNLVAISQALLSSFHVTNLGVQSVECDYPLLPPNNLFHLERLDFSVDEMTLPIDAFPRLPEMPSLKELRLSLELGFFGDLTNFYLIPWHQLRSFTVHYCPWPSEMLFDILQRCKSLVELTLLVYLYEGHERSIVLPNLENLVLEMDSDGCVDSLIRSLTVPNLRSLDIRSQFWRSYLQLPLSTEAIVIMAQHSGFKRLTSFSLCRTKQPVDVGSILGRMPALERVQFHGPLMFQPGTFDDLSSGMIGPQLEEIYFGIMSDEEIGLMLETVGQRHAKKMVSDIRSFTSVTCCTSGSHFESHSQRAKECGEAFDTHVEIRRVNEHGFSMESGSDDELYVDRVEL